jgi:RecB family endonuclease NucS
VAKKKGEKPKAKKSSVAEVERRVQEVLRIRLDGAALHDVVQYATEMKWDVSERQVSHYIRRADDLLVERNDRNRKRLLARHCAQRESLYARAVNGADYRTALAVVDSLAKLQGLFVAPSDVKELARLAAAQGARLVELEKRLEDARRNQADPPAAGPADGPPSGPDAGHGGDPGPLPPRPGGADA